MADCRADALGRPQACGAVGRFVATFICYPCFKLKVLAQSKKGNIKELYDKEGVAGVYKGFWSEMARGIVFNATVRRQPLQEGFRTLLRGGPTGVGVGGADDSGEGNDRVVQQPAAGAPPASRPPSWSSLGCRATALKL